MRLQAGLRAPTTELVDRDPKRTMWILGLVVPFLPLVSIAAHEASGWWPSLLLTPLLVFVVIPIQDALIGVDNYNISDDHMDEIANSAYYRLLVQLYVPLQYLSYGVAVWWYVNRSLSTLEVVVSALSVGIVAGIGINAAHEMGHKSDRFRHRLSQIALAQSAYGHFFVEHNRGHHRNVSTPEDPASSRYGESFWAFLPRTVIMSAVSAWRLEADRMARLDRPTFYWRNKNLQGWAMSLALFGVTFAYAGFGIIGFVVIQAATGFFLLEVVNYLEHYGLLRQKLPSGRYEKCRPEHSWNSNYRVTNVFLYQLQRHSDHHANPTRPYQLLRNIDGAPNLPSGYATMILLAVVPPLWFRVMNPRVAEVYDGDLSKANLSRRAKIKLGL